MNPRPLVVLEEVRIPTPCHADWDRMAGDNRSRFCDSCAKHVHDLKGYTRAEIAALFAAEEPPCVILTKTAAGRVRTADDPPWRGWWKPARFFVLVWAMAAYVSGSGCSTQGKPAPAMGEPVPLKATDPPAKSPQE